MFTFTGQSQESLKAHGFTMDESDKRYAMRIGGQARNGVHWAAKWFGQGVELMPVRAYRDAKRAEHYVRQYKPLGDDTGRTFIRQMGSFAGGVVNVVYVERYTD